MITLRLPDGRTLRTSSNARFHVIVDGLRGLQRVTSRDDLLPAVNAFHALRLKHRDVPCWLVDAESRVVRPWNDAEAAT